MRFMLLQDYFVEGVEPMSSWSPEDVKAHIDFQYRLNDELRQRGELVEAQGLAESARTVINDGVAPVVTDGPFPQSKELLAGYRIVDVESPERALEIAASASAAPGPGGTPIRQPIEVREVMGAPGASSDV
ncbi:MAG: YciI family protein [Gaiellaceae bacterium]|jgi:hypothetical protein